MLQPANGNLDEVFDDIKVIAGDTEKFDPAQEFTTRMKDGYMWQVWVEGYPYYSLLSYIGTPDHDKDTWEITGYPDQTYWFDWEGCAITAIEMDTSKADWAAEFAKKTGITLQ